MDQTWNAFNDLFYESEGDKPQWMQWMQTSGRMREDDEEKLLDDAHARFIAGSCSIDYSSLESQDSYIMDLDAETEVVLRVPMCCGSCENKAKSLTQMEGVTSVACDRRIEKVTVIGTARPRDILEACSKLFEQAKLWTPEDDAIVGVSSSRRATRF